MTAPTRKKTEAAIVSDALEAAKSERARLSVKSPRLDAFIAIMTADLRDRNTGLTVEGEFTPGLEVAIAYRVAAAFDAASDRRAVAS